MDTVVEGSFVSTMIEIFFFQLSIFFQLSNVAGSYLKKKKTTGRKELSVRLINWA